MVVGNLDSDDIASSTVIRQTMTNALRSNQMSNDQRLNLILNNPHDLTTTENNATPPTATTTVPNQDSASTAAAVNWEFKPKPNSIATSDQQNSQPPKQSDKPSKWRLGIKKSKKEDETGGSKNELTKRSISAPAGGDATTVRGTTSTELKKRRSEQRLKHQSVDIPPGEDSSSDHVVPAVENNSNGVGPSPSPRTDHNIVNKQKPNKCTIL